MEQSPYMTVRELSAHTRYSSRYIRERLNGNHFHEGVHYIRPFGGKKILYVRAAIEQELADLAHLPPRAIPMSRGRIAHG